MKKIMKKPSEIFPEVLWKADYNTVHLSRHLIPNYIDSENYSLYTNSDGTLVDRVYKETLNKDYFETKRDALCKIKNKLNSQIDTINEYLKEL